MASYYLPLQSRPSETTSLAWRWFLRQIDRECRQADARILPLLDRGDTVVLVADSCAFVVPEHARSLKCHVSVIPGPTRCLDDRLLEALDGVVYDVIFCDLLPDEWPSRFSPALREVLASRFRWLLFRAGPEASVANCSRSERSVVAYRTSDFAALQVEPYGNRRGDSALPLRLSDLAEMVSGAGAIDFLDLADVSAEGERVAMDRLLQDAATVIAAADDPSESSFLESLASARGLPFLNWRGGGSPLRWLDCSAGALGNGGLYRSLRTALEPLFRRAEYVPPRPNSRTMARADTWAILGAGEAETVNGWSGFVSSMVRRLDNRPSDPRLQFLENWQRSRIGACRLEWMTLVALAQRGLLTDCEGALKIWSRGLVLRFLERHLEPLWALVFGTIHTMCEDWVMVCKEALESASDAFRSETDSHARIGKGILHGSQQQLAFHRRGPLLELAKDLYEVDLDAGRLSVEAQAALPWLYLQAGGIDDAYRLLEKSDRKDYAFAAWTALQSFMPPIETAKRNNEPPPRVPDTVWKCLEKDVLVNGPSPLNERMTLLASLYAGRDDYLSAVWQQGVAPGNLGAVSNYAWLLGMNVLAREAAGKIGEVKATEPITLFDCACAQALSGRQEHARALFNRLVAISPGFFAERGFLGARSFFYAAALRALGQLEQAEDYRRLSLWVDPLSETRDDLWEGIRPAAAVQEVAPLRSWVDATV